MFNIGGGEILVIAMIALIAVGPEQLPSVMRKVGGFVAQIRSMTTGLRTEFMSGMEELDPTRLMGDGTDENPIVPRGYAENAAASSAAPKIPSATGPESSKGAEPADVGSGADEPSTDSSVTLDPSDDGAVDKGADTAVDKGAEE